MSTSARAASACPATSVRGTADAFCSLVAGDEARAKDAGMMLADQLLRYMDVLRVPNGLEALGYVKSDIPALVECTLPQKRVLNLAPQHSGKEEITELFNHSMRVY